MTDAWLYQRLVADRRRLLEPSLRARAALALAEDFIESRVRTLAVMRIDDSDEVSAEEARRVQLRSEFVSLMHVVEKLASDRFVVGYPRGPVVSGRDERVAAISRFGAIAGLDDRAVDAETWALVESNRRGLELSSKFMATLPASVPRYERPEPSSPSRRPRPKYDDSTLRVIVAKLTERELDEAELLDLADEHLGDLGTDMHAEATDARAGSVDDYPARRAALLRAATESYDQRSAAQRTAVKDKSKALASHLSGGDRVAYSARDTDLDTELIQPIREDLERFAGMVIRYAVRLDPSRNWPDGNTKLERALALGRSVVVSDIDLATARASLGMVAVS